MGWMRSTAPCVYMRAAMAGGNRRNRLVPRSSTYKLSWKSWCRPDDAPAALAPIHTFTACTHATHAAFCSVPHGYGVVPQLCCVPVRFLWPYLPP